MQRHMLKSKIHRACVTDANLNYVGSVSIDPHLLRQADILVGEQVQVVDVNNGARFETYAIEGRPQEVCLNGAAARLVQPGDLVIIISYAAYEPDELQDYVPRVVYVDDQNRPVTEAVARDIAGRAIVEPITALAPPGLP